MYPKDLVAASSKPLILSVLTEETSYGYRIIQRIKELSDGKMQWKDGMLYPILHRLEKLELIQSEWKTSESGRKRRYYKITDLGRETLQAEQKKWQEVNQLLHCFWDQAECSN